MYLIEFLKAMATGAILFVCFAFLLLWICIYWKKRKRRKKQPRQRMERGSPKIYPRRLPIGGHGQIVDLEMQNYCDGDKNERIISESTSVLPPEVSNCCKTKQVNEQTTRKKVKYACMYGKRRKGPESNHPGARCTGEFQNSEPIVKKKGSTVPPKSSVNSDGDQNGRSNSSSTSSLPPEVSRACKNNQAHKHHMTSGKIDLEIVNEQNLRKKVIAPSTLSSMQTGRKSEMEPLQPRGSEEGNRCKATGNNQPGAKFRGQLQNSESMTKKIFTTRSTVQTTSRSKSGKVDFRLLENNIH